MGLNKTYKFSIFANLAIQQQALKTISSGIKTTAFFKSILGE